MTFKLEDLREIHLLNYRLIESLDDPEENLITVALTFAPLNHSMTIGCEMHRIVDEQGELLRSSSLPQQHQTTAG